MALTESPSPIPTIAEESQRALRFELWRVTPECLELKTMRMPVQYTVDHIALVDWVMRIQMGEVQD